MHTTPYDTPYDLDNKMRLLGILCQEAVILERPDNRFDAQRALKCLRLRLGAHEGGDFERDRLRMFQDRLQDGPTNET